MKVILNDHVERLGERGEVVTVKPGYARNHLIPKGLAYPDSAGYRRLFEQEQTKWEEMDLGRRAAAEKMAGEMTGTELVFERRAGEKDVLFGSVTLVEISRELTGRGFAIDKKRIKLFEPIKALGTFEVDVQIHPEIKVCIPVHVVRPGEQPRAAKEAATEGEGADLTETEPVEP